MFDSCSLVCYKSHQVELCESRVENAAIQEVLQGNPWQRQTENQNITNINGKGNPQYRCRIVNMVLVG